MAGTVETLKWAAQNGEFKQVKDACEAPGFDINATDSVDRQLIHYVADYGQKEILEYLINVQNANINAVDKHGNTPLINAAFEGHSSCVKLLLDHNAKKDLKGPNDLTAYGAVCIADISEEQRNIIKDLLKD